MQLASDPSSLGNAHLAVLFELAGSTSSAMLLALFLEAIAFCYGGVCSD